MTPGSPSETTSLRSSQLESCCLVMDEEPGFQLPANAHLNLGGRQRKGRPSNAESEPVTAISVSGK